MKNPNGYGSVVKLSGNRRRPFAVRKTKGFDSKGYPIYNVIAYCSTREEGNIILAEYNKSPYDVDGAKITMEELFEKFREKKLVKMSASSRYALLAAFNHCLPVHSEKYRNLRSYHMQECIDDCGFGYATQHAIKNLFRHLDNYAIELDIITRPYSSLLTAEKIPETSKRPFTNEEIGRLWDSISTEWVDSVLIYIYTGFRLNELLGMKKEQIDYENGVFKGGLKTGAGKDRIVPIHSRIYDLVKKRTDMSNAYFLEYNGRKVLPDQYYKLWNGVMEALGMRHTPHECRHTFRSKLDSAGANKKCIDLMMGHKSKEVGERIYTHKTLAELKDAIELFDK